MNGVLLAIESNRKDMTKMEKLIADALLKEPSAVLFRSITEYSNYISSSPATIIRFCKRLGISGYPELKIKIANELSNDKFDDGSGTIGRVNLVHLETSSDLVDGVVQNALSSISQLGSIIDYQLVDEAASLIKSARHVILCGIGASGLVAKDLHQKLVRLGILSHCDEDLDVVKVQLSSSDNNDVIVLFSYSGVKEEIKRIAKLAKKRGVNIISCTKKGNNPIAALSDINLPVIPSEALVREGATVSRLQMLVLVDVLYQVLISKDARVTDTLLNTWNSVSGSQEDDDEQR